MEQTHAYIPDTQQAFITNTIQYDHLLDIFIYGVHYLEYHINLPEDDRMYSPSNLSNLAKQLPILVTSLTSFLGYLTKQHSPVHSPTLRNLQYIKNTWLREAISNLRIYCHRYSLAVLKIIHALRQQCTNACSEDNDLDSGNVEFKYCSGIGVDGRTSTPSWWSCMGAVGGSSSASLDGSYHDSDEVIWNWMSPTIVQEDMGTYIGGL